MTRHHFIRESIAILSVIMLGSVGCSQHKRNHHDHDGHPHHNHDGTAQLPSKSQATQSHRLERGYPVFNQTVTWLRPCGNSNSAAITCANPSVISTTIACAADWGAIRCDGRGSAHAGTPGQGDVPL